MARLPEQRAWDNFSGSINKRLIWPQRVENMVLNSMPDVICLNHLGTTFWLENKAIDSWPARSTTFPLRDRFQPGQLSWARQWRASGGFSYVLLRVGLDFYLLNPDYDLDKLTQTGLLASACITHGKKEIMAYLEELKRED